MLSESMVMMMSCSLVSFDASLKRSANVVPSPLLTSWSTLRRGICLVN